jgi:hypothetical protein
MLPIVSAWLPWTYCSFVIKKFYSKNKDSAGRVIQGLYLSMCAVPGSALRLEGTDAGKFPLTLVCHQSILTRLFRPGTQDDCTRRDLEVPRPKFLIHLVVVSASWSRQALIARVFGSYGNAQRVCMRDLL